MILKPAAPTPAHFQNHENVDCPMYAFLMILKPIAPFPPTSKDMKMMIVPCISYDSAPSRRPLLETKDMKTVTVVYISYGSGAN